MQLSEAILKLDKGVRVVATFNSKGKLLDIKTRGDVSLVMPPGVLRGLGSSWFTVLGGVLKQMEYYYGMHLRSVLHYKKIDVIMIRRGDDHMIVFVDKSVPSDVLSRKIKSLTK